MDSSATQKKHIPAQQTSLTRQIQVSGFIVIFLFLGVLFLSISFFRQIKIQNQDYEVGTLFSDRSVTQTQRELLRLRSLVVNPNRVHEDEFELQFALLQSRLNILDDSLTKIHPNQEIITEHDKVVDEWERLTVMLADWQAIQEDAALQEAIITQIDEIELLINEMVRLYEMLRVSRGVSFADAGNRLAIMLGVVVILFILFMISVVYNTYRFIEERSRAEEQLAIYAGELERSNLELQQFAYVASHDLQEPLRKIRIFGERLQARNEDKLDGRSLDYIKRMRSASKRMQTLIEDLLTFSRVTTQASPFEKTELNHIVKEVLIDLETRIEEVNGAIKVEELPSIEADPLQMRQLFQNLLSNGLKFHRESVAPVVVVKCEVFNHHGRKQVRLFVEDNGIGIEDEYQDRIFQLFQRLHGRGEYEGTGIGLAICRRIIERHHGTITMNSQVDNGTTFIVTLPVEQPNSC